MNAAVSFHMVPADQIAVSFTEAQIQRRQHFDKTALDELAVSVKDAGVLQPILVRPIHQNGKAFEIVYGERRFLAAQLAGLEEVPANIRELTDDQVLEIQLIENLQREGLHPLSEAEGYEQLAKHGHAAEEIAAKVGKSKAYIYARMKLLALAKDGRKAFYDGKISVSIALLLARIPVEDLQKKALKEITAADRFDGPMSYREAQIHVQEDYMLRLDAAGFKTEDETLVPGAGKCSACPKRTGNQPELFSDIKRGDVCTDPSCFKSKRDAQSARAIAEAEAGGRKIISGKDAKKIFPYSSEHPSGPYSALDDRPFEDPKNRTARQLMGKSYEPVLVQHPESGKLIELVPDSAIKTVLRDAGVKPRGGDSGNAEYLKAEKKRKFERKYRLALYEQIRSKLPAKFVEDDLRHLAYRFFDEIWNDAQKAILEMWELDTGSRGDRMKDVKDKLKDLSEDELVRFVWDCIFCRELLVSTYSNEPASLLTAAAKKLKLNPEKFRAEMQAADKAKEKAKSKPAKKAKGKRS